MKTGYFVSALSSFVAVVCFANEPVPPDEISGTVTDVRGDQATIALQGPRSPDLGDSVVIRWHLADGETVTVGGGNIVATMDRVATAQLTNTAGNVFPTMEATIYTYAGRRPGTGDGRTADAEASGKPADMTDEDFLAAVGRVVDPYRAFEEGTAYWNGDGVEQSYEKAAERFRYAAENDHIEAQGWYGLMLMKGQGVVRNAEAGMSWLLRSANAGSAEAANNIGLAYLEGWGIPTDNARACEWWRKSAAQQHNWGLFNTGLCYANGWAGPVDYAQAATYYRRATETGLPAAYDSLGRLYQLGRGVALSLETAVDWYRKAAEAGHANGQNNLGWMYHEGIGIEKDDREAVRWFRLAAANGSSLAERNLQLAEEEGWLNDATGDIASAEPEDVTDELDGLW